MRHAPLTVSAVGFLLLIVAFVVATGQSGGSAPVRHAVAHAASVSVQDTTGCDGGRAVSLLVQSQGFSHNDFSIGETNVNWSDPVAQSAGDGAFGREISTSKSLVAFIGSSDPKAELLLQRKLDDGKANGATKAQLLDASNWVAFQAKVAMIWPANTWIAGSIIKSGSLHVPAGDAGWIFVSPVGCAPLPAVTIRAGCDNGEAFPQPVPAPPAPQPTPVTPASTPTPGPTPCTTCTKPSQVLIPPQQQNPGVYTGPTKGAPSSAPTTNTSGNGYTSGTTPGGTPTATPEASTGNTGVDLDASNNPTPPS